MVASTTQSHPTESVAEELAGICAAEAEAMESRRAAADLKIRAALLLWDARRDATRALALLDRLDHPAAPALRLDIALAGSDSELLKACVAEARRRIEPAELAELGRLLLWRSAEERRTALQLLEAAGADGRVVRELALAVEGRWAELCTLLEGQLTDGADVAAVVERAVEAADLAEHRLKDRARADALLQRAFERHPRLVATGRVAYFLERLQAILELPAPLAIEVLRHKRTLLTNEARQGAERRATEYKLLSALEKSGGVREAAELAVVLCEEERDFSAALVWQRRGELEGARGEWKRAADAFLQRAERGGSALFGLAHRRRAALLIETRVGDAAAAEAMYADLLASEPADGNLARALFRLRLLRGDAAGARTALEEAGRALAGAGDGRELLAVAARAPAADDGDAVLLWRELATDRSGLEGWARAARRASDRGQLLAAYGKLAAQSEPRRAAAYFAVAGALALGEGRLEEAAKSFDAAAEREPDDLLCQAGRVTLFRRAGQYAELAAALQRLIALVRAKPAQVRLYRQLARVAAEQLNDADGAVANLERALELIPDDVKTLTALAELVGKSKKWSRAVELLERAAAAAVEPPARALILCDLGKIYEAQLNDEAQARGAYDRALAVDAQCLGALEALAALHRRHARVPELLDVLRRELALTATPARRLDIYLEIAAAADQPLAPKAGEGKPTTVSTKTIDPEAALDAYLQALRLLPSHPVALAGFERLCRRLERWQLLADELGALAPTQADAPPLAMLRARGEALSRLARWSELAEVRETELQLVAQKRDGHREVATVARALAQLYEERLGDVDAAARAWHRLDEADPHDVSAAQALARIYERKGRFADLAAAIERELQVGSADAARQLTLWLKLGDIRRHRLGRLEAAAEAYEHALALDGHSVEALTQLAEIYDATMEQDELARVLDLRAAVTVDPADRASVLQQKGELLEKSGDLDGALAAYAGSFRLDPSSRTCFTAYERLCYKLEQWNEAMSLYDLAIDLVEVKKARVYRLADLYARRGQLQLQYLGQAADAAGTYLRVLELDPEGDLAQSALERIYSVEGNWRGLIAAYERRAQLVTDDARRVEILRRAARVAAAKLKDGNEAARLYGALHAADATDGEALDTLERHYERTRAWEPLVGILTTRLSLTAGGDESIALYLRIAHHCEEGLRDAERAIFAYRKVLDIAPSHKEAIEALGRLYEATEKWADFVEVTRRQIRIVLDRGQKALLYFKCGSVMESKFGKEDDAIRYYDAAIKTSPSCLPAVHGLRDLYLRKQDWPHVIETLELEAKLWTDDKERAGVFASVGQIYADKLGAEDRAISFYEKALSVDRECLPANRSLFELYFARGEYVRALPVAVILTQKVQREGDPVERSEFYRKRAVVAEKTDDPQAAAESLVIALEIRPENQGALDLLVQLCRARPDVYDFPATFDELEKLYRKREMWTSVARVLVGRGGLAEAANDLDRADTFYQEALRLGPEELRVVEALVGLCEKLRRFDEAVGVLEQFIARAPELAQRSWARFRLAEIHGDDRMDSARAAEALRELTVEEPNHRQGLFRLAQELYLMRRYGDAQRACERLIRLSSVAGGSQVAGAAIPPEELARYYDYLGRIEEAAGDSAGAGRSFRRAIELDPAYPPASLSLARRAAAGGDREAATDILNTALQAAELRGSQIDLAIRRGIARLHLGLGDFPRAVDAYRMVLNRAPEREQSDDRFGLAELLLQMGDGLTARAELHHLLVADPRYVPAYRLLVQLHERGGDLPRASRLASVPPLLGYGEISDRRPTMGWFRLALSDAERRGRLLPPTAQGLLFEAFLAVKEQLEAQYGLPRVEGARSVDELGEAAWRAALGETQRLLGVQAEVYVVDRVAGRVLSIEQPRPAAFVERSLLTVGEAERRFVFGRALEPLRGGYALILRLDADERAAVGRLLEQLVRPAEAREPDVRDFIKALPKKAAKALERVEQMAQPLPLGGQPSAELFFSGLTQAANRAGLLASDDIHATARALAAIEGVPQDNGPVNPARIGGLPELLRFFVSDGYSELASGSLQMGLAPPPPSGPPPFLGGAS